MTFAEIEKFVVRTSDGKMFYYLGKQKKIIRSLAWMVSRFTHLEVHGLEVHDIHGKDGGVLLFRRMDQVRQLTSEEAATVAGFWRYCEEVTLGVERTRPIWLPTVMEAPTCDPKRNLVLIFTDQGRAEMCRNMLWNVFELESKIQQECGGWILNLQSDHDGNRTISAQDMLRLEGACALLARHVIAPAPSAIREVTKPDQQPASKPKALNEPKARPARQGIRPPRGQVKAPNRRPGCSVAARRSA